MSAGLFVGLLCVVAPGEGAALSRPAVTAAVAPPAQPGETDSRGSGQPPRASAGSLGQPASPATNVAVKLPPPKASLGDAKFTGSLPLAGPPLTGVAFSLAGVIGLFLLCAFLFGKTAGKGQGPLPKEVVEVLGRLPIPGRQHLELMRVGRKLILVCHTPAGIETLTEIDEPEEVDRLVGLCHEGKPGSASANFRQVLLEMGREKTAGGFWGSKPSAALG